MKDIYKKLSYSLKWLSLESLLYQAIFMIHQIVLFRISGCTMYGTIGAIFSIIYLTVTITSFGLETSLSPFFKELTKNKQIFKRFFVSQFAITFLLSLLTFCVFILLKNLGKSIFSHQINIFFIVIMSLLVLSESIKKTLRGILYLSFKNKINTCIEIIAILSYVSAIWLIYLVTKKIDINTIFIPMLIMSLISNMILFIWVHRFYCNLKNKNTPTDITAKRILKCRFFNFTNQFGHNLFSGNFLVPFFAVTFGLAQAGIFKLLSHITYIITMLMRKIFGWASDALLSQTKDFSMSDKQNIFNSITTRMYHILLAVVIFLTINIGKIVKFTNSPQELINWQLIYFFLAITLTENLFISYEKFYIAEEKNGILLALNLCSMFILSFIISYASFFPQQLLLLSIVATRATFFALLALISFKTWNIRPSFRIQPEYVAISTIISIIFFTIS